MSRVGALAVAGRSAVSKFHELRLKYWNTELDVTCCFEGSDDIEFYLPRVRHELGLHRERIDFVNCGGKGVVLTLWSWVIERAWNLARVGFFVDRDLDDFLKGNPSGQQLYVTDLYSIESHIVDPDFFDNVWQDSFRLSITDGRREGWRNSYYRGLEAMAKLLSPLFYVAISFKRKGGGVDFEKVNLESLLRLSEALEVERRRPAVSISYEKVFADPRPSILEVRVARLDLASVDYRLWLRGKFAMWYAMLFFSRMKTVLGSRSQPNRAVVKATFNSESAVACLCGRATVPVSLVDFLQRWSARIVRDGLVPLGSANP